jgi:hypothetical protein
MPYDLLSIPLLFITGKVFVFYCLAALNFRFGGVASIFSSRIFFCAQKASNHSICHLISLPARLPWVGCVYITAASPYPTCGLCNPLYKGKESKAKHCNK